MELSGGLVLGLKPVGRKSGTVVHCYSEWPLRVHCDGQSRAAHTGSLYRGFLGLSHCLFFFPASLTQCYTRSYTHTHFLCLRPRDLASAVRPDIVITNSL